MFFHIEHCHLFQRQLIFCLWWRILMALFQFSFCLPVKPEPPFSIQVTKFEEFYNITWDHVNHVDCLSYTVRIRDREGLSQVICEQKHQNNIWRVWEATVTNDNSILTGSCLFSFTGRKTLTTRPKEAAATGQLYCGCEDQNVSWESLFRSMERVELHCRMEDYRDNRTPWEWR